MTIVEQEIQEQVMADPEKDHLACCVEEVLLCGGAMPPTFVSKPHFTRPVCGPCGEAWHKDECPIFGKCPDA